MNRNRHRTIIYGDSLILAGVRSELSGNPDLEVITLNDPLENPAEGLRLLNPDMIIFDLSAVQPDFPLAVLQRPNLLLIGIDPESHQALVWSGKQAPAVVAGDLLAIVQNNELTTKDNIRIQFKGD